MPFFGASLQPGIQFKGDTIMHAVWRIKHIVHIHCLTWELTFVDKFLNRPPGMEEARDAYVEVGLQIKNSIFFGEVCTVM